MAQPTLGASGTVVLLFKNRISYPSYVPSGHSGSLVQSCFFTPVLPGFTPDEPRTSKDADKIGNPRRQYSWNSTALAQGGSNGHDGIVDKNDDNADAQADGGTGAMRR